MASIPLCMARGDTATLTLTLSGLPSTGLSGCQLYFTAKRDVSDPDSAAVLSKSTGGNGVTITTTGSDTTSGVAEVLLQPADTSGLPPYTTVLVWDAVVVDGAGSHFTVAYGTLTVTPDVRQGN